MPLLRPLSDMELLSLPAILRRQFSFKFFEWRIQNLHIVEIPRIYFYVSNVSGFSKYKHANKDAKMSHARIPHMKAQLENENVLLIVCHVV